MSGSKHDFAVVIMQPPNYVHSLAFLETAQLVHLSLSSLGYKSELCFNRISPDKVNIIFGYNLLAIADIPHLQRADCVIYQLEQLSTREGWFDDRSLRVLKSVDRVWDYSELNLAFLRDRGVDDAKLLRIGYHEGLKKITPAPEPDIDVLFYGSINERRAQVLDKLGRLCRTEKLFAVFGEDRDAYIARAKIVLNIHFYEAQLLEQVRLSYLLNNGCFVVSEASRDNPWGESLVTVEFSAIVETCRRYLARDADRNELARHAYLEFKSMPMTANLIRVLEAENLL